MDTKTNTKILISAVAGIILGAGGVILFGPEKQATPVAMNVQNNPSDNSMMTALEGKKGENFDREFIIQMTMHHQGAIQMAETALRTSKRPEIIELSKNIIAAQNTEIQQMQEWYQTWFGSSMPTTSSNSAQSGSVEHGAQ